MAHTPATWSIEDASVSGFGVGVIAGGRGVGVAAGPQATSTHNMTTRLTKWTLLMFLLLASASLLSGAMRLSRTCPFVAQAGSAAL
jgi:hypothetical protein